MRITQPEHLRETAAWLLAHAPGESRLAFADPEALVAHSSYITSAELGRPRSRPLAGASRPRVEPGKRRQHGGSR